MNEVPNCFYRVSVKALVLNEERNRFLLVREERGVWDLPGGGLDWGNSVEEDLKREVREEMGLEVVSVAKQPSYFVTSQNERGVWTANVLYEVVLKSFNFTPSEECVEARFVNSEEVKELNLLENVQKFAEVFVG